MGEATAVVQDPLLKPETFTLRDEGEGTSERAESELVERTNGGTSLRREETPEEEDFVVYADAAAAEKLEDVSQRFESRTAENSRKDELRPERHEITFEEAASDGEEASESAKLVERAPPALVVQTPAVNCFQDVPLLRGEGDAGRGVLFEGLVFCDTVDALYRPVVVINTRAIPHKSLRTAALKHLCEALEPVVSTGPYVLIFTSFAASNLSTLPVSWVVAAYKELSHPFKKNVQHVILVRPNKFLKAFVRVMKFVVKKKAHAKIKQVRYLGDIEAATDGEVAMEHLSPKVIQALGNEESNYSDLSTMTT